jgi:hypothetical protein
MNQFDQKGLHLLPAVHMKHLSGALLEKQREQNRLSILSHRDRIMHWRLAPSNP